METTKIKEKRKIVSEKICEGDDCTGCGACAAICPLGCIEMSSDSEGFYSPRINIETCIGCNKCRTCCPSLSNLRKDNMIPSVAYAFINGNPKVLEKSSSGGAFAALADWAFRQNGIVYSCVYDNTFKAIFSKAKSRDELAPMHGSKYVESRAWDIFSEVQRDLQENRIVMFVGLPCQVAGLYSFLGDKIIKNLYTVDLLCHGVPSHGLFEAYLKMIEEKDGRIIKYLFRSKKWWGWGSWGYYSYKEGDLIKEKKLLVANDYYYGLYFKENNYKESCYHCKYATLPRLSDITIGDCWHIDDIMPGIEYKKGVSLVLLNSVKAQVVYEQLKKENYSKEFSVDTAIKYNKTIMHSANRPNDRDTFYLDFNKLGFERAAKRYCRLKYILPLIARYMPDTYKKKIKRFLKKNKGS